MNIIMIEESWKEYSEKGTPEAREKLIIVCLPYIKSLAHRLERYTDPSQDVDDLISAGLIGFMDALEKYDPTKGSSFKNYARYRIHGSIMDEIRSMDWVPYYIREKARKIEKIYAKLEQDSDKAPDEEDMAKAMGISLDKYRGMLMKVNRMTLSLLDNIIHDEDMPYMFGDGPSGDPEEELMLAETETLLGEAIERLPEKERLVVTLHYYEEMTMKEIGKVLDVSESRVCQIHSSAVLRLHTRLKYMTADMKV